MAVVPIAETTQRLDPLSGARFQAADMTAGAEAVGVAAARFGQTTAQYAEAVDQRQQAVDVAGAKQHDLEFSAFATNTLFGDGQQSTGYKGTRGQNALTARGDTETALRQKAAEIIGKASDPRQRTLLTNAIGTRLNDAIRTVGEHAQEQTLQYNRETSAARLTDLTDQAVRYSDDPTQFGALLNAAATEVHSRAAQEGWGSAQEDVEVQKARDGVYTGVVQKMAITDPLAAKRYLDLHRDVIGTKAATTLDAQLSAHVEDATADQAARMARGELPTVTVHPTALSPARDALFLGTKDVESGGRNGLRSPAGALGTMQVMPATAKAVCAKLGIPYDEDRLRNDPEYCDRIGRAYQDGLLRKYGGNATLAAAAYNAGEAAVDDWRAGTNRSGKNASGLKIGDPLKGEVSDNAFIAAIPFKETRAYVPQVLNRAAARTGGPMVHDAVQPGNLEQKTAAIRAMGLPYDVEAKAIAKLNSYDAQDQRVVADGQKRAYEALIPMAMDPGAKSIKDIPPALFSAASPEQQRTIVSMLDHNAKGVDAPPNPKLYLQAVQASADDPAKFARTDLTPLVGKLPKADVDRLMARQKEILTSGGTSPKAVASGHIDEVTADIRRAAGLSMQGVKKGEIPAIAARVMDLHNGISADVEAFHASTGKYPTDDQIRQFAMRRTTKVTLPGTGGWFGSDKTALLSEVAPGTRVAVDIPNTERAKIIAAAKRAGRTLTEAQIGQVYLSAGKR